VAEKKKDGLKQSKEFINYGDPSIHDSTFFEKDYKTLEKVEFMRRHS